MGLASIDRDRIPKMFLVLDLFMASAGFVEMEIYYDFPIKKWNFILDIITPREF